MGIFQILLFHVIRPTYEQQPIGRVSQPQANGHGGGLPVPFQSLLAETVGHRPNQQVNMFTTVLMGGLTIDLEMQYLVNLGAAMNMAQTFERKQQFNQTGGNRPTAPTWPTLKPSISTPPTMNQDSKGPGGAKPAASKARSEPLLLSD